MSVLIRSSPSVVPILKHHLVELFKSNSMIMSRQQVTLQIQLLDAAKEGKTDELAQLLEQRDVDIDVKDWEPRLYAAAVAKKADEVAALLSQGFDIDYKDEVGETALHKAARNDHHASVKLLLDMGADVEAKDNVGQTALHKAARHDHHAIVNLLLDMGANIEAKDKDGINLLHYAAYKGQDALLKLLLDRGADITSTNKNGSTALHRAVSFNQYATATLLLERGARINERRDDEYTAFHDATLSDCATRITFLLDNGADIEAKNDMGATALHIATRNGNTDTVTLLLHRGADIYAMNHKDQYPEDLVSYYEISMKMILENWVMQPKEVKLFKEEDVNAGKEDEVVAKVAVLLGQGADQDCEDKVRVALPSPPSPSVAAGTRVPTSTIMMPEEVIQVTKADDVSVPPSPSSSSLSSSVPLGDLSGSEVRLLLGGRLGLPQLVEPFRAKKVDGRLLIHVECVQDLIDIDAQFVKPLFARRLFAQLVDWKGAVSREMLQEEDGDVIG